MTAPLRPLVDAGAGRLCLFALLLLWVSAGCGRLGFDAQLGPLVGEESDALSFPVDAILQEPGCPHGMPKAGLDPCVCVASRLDTDADGAPDCADGCPTDPTKQSGGVCGCGHPDVDRDADGVADCVDGCPWDGGKPAPGICGCGIADEDRDGDGVVDCVDGCPEDAPKSQPGVCGCAVEDTDSDRDGTPDCVDSCPLDADKDTPGVCGCSTADGDRDQDGRADCIDGCPDDRRKFEEGACGCGQSEYDGDGDGVPDCADHCPQDGTKIVPGECGCGATEGSCSGPYLNANVSGAQGSRQVFELRVPQGASRIVFRLRGGWGDPDMLVRRGAHPSSDANDCYPFKAAGEDEVCVLRSAGLYYVKVHGYSRFGGWTLTGDYE